MLYSKYKIQNMELEHENEEFAYILGLHLKKRKASFLVFVIC